MIGIMKKSFGVALAAVALVSFGTVAPAAALQAKGPVANPEMPTLCLLHKIYVLCPNLDK